MKNVTSVELMRKSDQYTIKTGTSSKDLMFAAGKNIFETIKWFGHIAVVCGKGNNGGDGFVLSKLLVENNFAVELFLCENKFSDDGLYFFEQCKALNISYTFVDEETDFSNFDIIVDCILGIGVIGEPTGLVKTAIEKINIARKYVVSVDINSGLNGDNGLCTVAVKSNITVSVGSFKSGHFLNQAKDYIDELSNVDIGINIIDKSYQLFELSDAKQIFLHRPNFSNKCTFGSSSILGGCLNYSGAVKLANLSSSSLRSGSGLSNVIVPTSIAAGMTPYLLESTLNSIDDIGGNMQFNQAQIDLALKKTSALCIGVGWGISEENKKILAYILEKYSLPILIDADGINNLCNLDESIFSITKCKIILTPHIIEFSRLSGFSKEEILKNPIELAKNYAKRRHIMLLLKGSSTIVTDGEEVYLTDKGCVGMAKGGSGDVLSGIINGLNAFSSNTLLLNTICGAFINGLAGELAEKDSNPFSTLPSDTIANIKKAISTILNIE